MADSFEGGILEYAEVMADYIRMRLFWKKIFVHCKLIMNGTYSKCL